MFRHVRTSYDILLLYFSLQIQGAIMVASLFQVLIGFSGLMGFVMRFIGPLVVAPTISLIGLALFDTASEFAKKQWWITLVYANF